MAGIGSCSVTFGGPTQTPESRTAGRMRFKARRVVRCVRIEILYNFEYKCLGVKMNAAALRGAKAQLPYRRVWMHTAEIAKTEIPGRK